MAGGKSRKVGSSKSKKYHKTHHRGKFESRHIDQVWEDVRKEYPANDGKIGPVGTTDRVELDDDLPAQGKYYCTPCARYFVSGAVLAEHERTKAHKKRVKVLEGARPHNQRDAEAAGGLGPPDNGPKLNRGKASATQDAVMG